MSSHKQPSVFVPIDSCINIIHLAAGCNHSPCQTKCCLCTVVRTRPVCTRCCEEDDETQPGGLPFPPKIAPINFE